MIYEPLEIADAEGKGTGKWRVVGRSDEENVPYIPMCSHEHASAKEAHNCPAARGRLGVLFVREEPEEDLMKAVVSELQEMPMEFWVVGAPTTAKVVQALRDIHRALEEAQARAPFDEAL